MIIRVASWILLSASVLAGCGASSNSAPIVYGTNPGSSGRIYNSPADVYLSRSETPAQQQTAYQPQRVRATPQSRPTALAPVTQTVYERALPPTPVYVAETDPVVAPKAGWGQSSSARVISVQPGDTVYALSRRTGVSPQAIIRENGLVAPFMLEVGQAVRIPSASAKVANVITQPAPQPVSTRRAPASSQAITVARGDTLYAISRRTGVSVAAIAQANNLRPPYALSVGQRLRMPGATSITAPTPQAGFTQTVSYKAPEPVAPAVFDWPVKGAVIGRFGEGDLGRRNDGINIAAPVGTPVRAAADGEVVYRGSELDGYGNLLLIKHDDGFVTAYAHNDAMLVRKGQRVRQGQVIAKVGQTGAAAEPQLHFEIRQNLKSIDPLAFLQ